MARTIAIIAGVAIALWLIVHILSLILRGAIIFTLLRILIVAVFIAVVVILCMNYRNNTPRK